MYKKIVLEIIRFQLDFQSNQNSRISGPKLSLKPSSKTYADTYLCKTCCNTNDIKGCYLAFGKQCHKCGYLNVSEF